MKAFVAVAAAVLSAACGSAHSQNQQVDLWSSGFLPCSLQICGGFRQNIATMRMTSGGVAVESDGRVRVAIEGLRKRMSGQIVANKTLEVWVGNYVRGKFQGGPINPIGTIVTDANGDFSGYVVNAAGLPFVYESGSVISAQFGLNDPLVRSEFITGFVVP